MCKLLVIPDLPDAAVGVQKIAKVRTLRTMVQKGEWLVEVDYVVVRLGNGEVFSLFPDQF